MQNIGRRPKSTGTMPGSGNYITNVVLPIKEHRFFPSGMPLLRPYHDLMNGNKVENNVIFSYQPLNHRYQPFSWTAHLPKQWDTIIRKVIIYSHPAGLPMNAPTKFYAIRRDNRQAVLIGDYPNQTGFPLELTLPTEFITDKIQMIGFAGQPGNQGVDVAYGNEIEWIGDYKDVPEPVYMRITGSLGKMIGHNTFYWDYTLNPNEPWHAFNPYMNKINSYSEIGMKTARFYVRADDITTLSRNEWAFQPTAISNVSGGAWQLDTTMQASKDNGHDPMLTIMGLPRFLQAEHGGYQNAFSSAYTQAIHKDDRRNPLVYTDFSRIAFITGARYGANAAISPSVMGNYYYHPSAQEPRQNEMKIGMNICKYFQYLNEPDATWLGEYGYMDGEMLMAFCSACFDGHMGQIDVGYGPGIGVGLKNADPTAKYIIPAFALESIGALRAGYDWVIANRGFLPNGKPNWPFDIIDYHHYSNNKKEVFMSAPIETGVFSCGMPPELSDVEEVAEQFVEWANEYADGVEVWMSEWGYDFREKSACGVRAYGGYTHEEVVGIWSVRQMLSGAKIGLNRMLWFKTYANDQNYQSDQFFDVMALFTMDDPMYIRFPVADYMMQLNQYKDYKIDAIISNTNPRVYRFKKDTGEIMYTIHSVDTKIPEIGNRYIPGVGYANIPVYNYAEVTGTYNLVLPTNPLVNVRTFETGRNEMTMNKVQVAGGVLAVNYGMKPIIISLDQTEPTPNIIPNANAGADQAINFPANSVNLDGSASFDADGAIIGSLWKVVQSPVDAYGGSQASITITLGIKNLVVATGLTWQANQDITLEHDWSNKMFGKIVSYNSGNGALQVNITTIFEYATQGMVFPNGEWWTVHSRAQIGNKSALMTNLTGLIVGTYVLQLLVEDDDHAYGFDTVTITVNP